MQCSRKPDRTSGPRSRARSDRRDPRFQGASFVARNITSARRRTAHPRLAHMTRSPRSRPAPFPHSSSGDRAHAPAGRELALIYRPRPLQGVTHFGHSEVDRALGSLESHEQELPRTPCWSRLAGDELPLHRESPGATTTRVDLALAAGTPNGSPAVPARTAELYGRVVGIALAQGDATSRRPDPRRGRRDVYSNQNGHSHSFFRRPEMIAIAVSGDAEGRSCGGRSSVTSS